MIQVNLIILELIKIKKIALFVTDQKNMVIKKKRVVKLVKIIITSLFKMEVGVLVKMILLMLQNMAEPIVVKWEEDIVTIYLKITNLILYFL